jgi:hypothetical protein
VHEYYPRIELEERDPKFAIAELLAKACESGMHRELPELWRDCPFECPAGSKKATCGCPLLATKLEKS